MSAFAASPKETLEKCAAKIRAAKSLAVTYTIQADGKTSQGAMLMSGDKFTLSTPEVMSWFDGKTQWTYSSQIGEVNITEPTRQEVQQVNPFSLIGTVSRDYKVSSLKAPAGHTALQLTPTRKGTDLRSADLTVSNSTLYPTRIVLTLANGQRVTLTVKSIKAGNALPASNFRYNPKAHPELPVVDLR